MKIPIAIVGLNYGRWIIEALDDKEKAGRHFQLAAVSDLDVEKGCQVAAENNVKFATLIELLSDPDIPAIGLFTGPVGRADLLSKIIHSGKHVMTTKPFELDAQKAAEVLREAHRLKKVIHLNSPGPLTPPDIATIEDWHRHHKLGRPVGCRAETYATYDEQADGSWYDDPERCPVSPVFRIGIYLINDLVRLFGEAESVQVFTSRIRTGRPTPDNAQLGILFKNGAVANVFASLCIDDGQRWTDSLILNYERGTIYRNIGPMVFGGGPEGTTKLHLLTRRAEASLTQVAFHETRSGQYQWEAFHRAIRGERIETPMQELASALRIIAAMGRAERSGKAELV